MYFFITYWPNEKSKEKLEICSIVGKQKHNISQVLQRKNLQHSKPLGKEKGGPGCGLLGRVLA